MKIILRTLYKAHQSFARKVQAQLPCHWISRSIICLVHKMFQWTAALVACHSKFGDVDHRPNIKRRVWWNQSSNKISSQSLRIHQNRSKPTKTEQNSPSNSHFLYFFLMKKKPLKANDPEIYGNLWKLIDESINRENTNSRIDFFHVNLSEFMLSVSSFVIPFFFFFIFLFLKVSKTFRNYTRE